MHVTMGAPTRPYNPCGGVPSGWTSPGLRGRGRRASPRDKTRALREVYGAKPPMAVEPTTLSTWGLPGMFVIAILAGSVVPVPSEAMLAALIYNGTPPVLATAVATVGNVLGALTLYYLGRWVSQGGGGPVGRWVARRRQNEGPRMQRVEANLRAWGAPALMMSWLPVLGDAFVLAGGFVGVRPLPFVVFVTLGKGLRYAFVALSTTAAM
jgi:membrane protein YqaA with SNARE-associated domain